MCNLTKQHCPRSAHGAKEASLVLEVKALMHSRGFVLTRLLGRTETATILDPLGTPERGSNSTSTESCNASANQCLEYI